MVILILHRALDLIIYEGRGMLDVQNQFDKDNHQDLSTNYTISW